MTGTTVCFNVDEVSLLDINALIDKGKRFTISNKVDGCISVKEYLDGSLGEPSIFEGTESNEGDS